MKNKVEILAPAGSYEVFKAVINAGADAVYLAGNMFGARAYAGNFTNEELISAIKYSKIHNRKLYLTVNTLLKNRELYNELYNYLLPLYNAGLDAVIVQDYGVMDYIHRCFPDMEIHASTQMTITDSTYALFLKKYGVTRIVPARELSLNEIKKLHSETGMEIESFVHGALCYCYSGMCFMSSFIGGRSGNRGRCAGTCRLEFKKDGKEQHLLSLKDLCTLDILPEIIEAGVYSLKIEGRMKSAEYAAGVTSIYRKYVDLYFEKGSKGYSVDKKDIEKLLLLFDRGGMTNGYYLRHNSKEMMADEQKSDKSLTAKKDFEEYIHNSFVVNENKLKVNAIVTIVKDNPVTMTLSYNNHYVTVSGDNACEALNKAVTKEDVIRQIKKFGQTMFEPDEIDVVMDDNVFISVKSLNELRRKAADALCDEMLKGSERTNAGKYSEIPAEQENEFRGISVRVMDINQAMAAISHNIKRLVIDTESISMDDILTCINKCHQRNILAYIGFPRVTRYSSDFITNNLKELIESGVDGFMIRNIAQKGILDNFGYKGDVIADYTCYAFNNQAAACISDYGINGVTYPVELNEKEISGLSVSNSELLVYGKIPLMYSANCIDNNTSNCHKPDGRFTEITDRKNAHLPVYTCCRYCYNIIYNSVPLYLIDKYDSIMKIRLSYLGLSFADESAGETDRILTECEAVVYGGKKIQAPDKNFTRGHFTRGVE